MRVPSVRFCPREVSYLGGGGRPGDYLSAGAEGSGPGGEDTRCTYQAGGGRVPTGGGVFGRGGGAAVN